MGRKQTKKFEGDEVIHQAGQHFINMDEIAYIEYDREQQVYGVHFKSRGVWMELSEAEFRNLESNAHNHSNVWVTK